MNKIDTFDPIKDFDFFVEFEFSEWEIVWNHNDFLFALIKDGQLQVWQAS